MKKRLYLAVKRQGMTSYAQQNRWQMMSEEEYLNLEEVRQVVSTAQRFGDKVRLMEDDPNPNNPNKIVRDLV